MIGRPRNARLVLLIGLLLTGALYLHPFGIPFAGPGDSAAVTIQGRNTTGTLHVVLLATKPDINLCKTLLSLASLGYPVPTLLGWDKTDGAKQHMFGGSHLLKITDGAPYFAALQQDTDDDLVLVADAYDVWLQLPPEILVQRWHDITRSADGRLSKRMGVQISKYDLKHSIVFGSVKRCSPNLHHTVACYAVPESPLPNDLYGTNTDTIVGKNRWSSLRQRYLNAGIAIGTVSDMRRIFSRATDKLSQAKDHEDFDNGSYESDFVYHGSDQSVWNTIFGEQEFQREVIRRQWNSTIEPSWMEGTKINDPINPSFTHQTMDRAEPGQYEFGIALDYWSEITQQTINAEQDARFLQYSRPFSEQMRVSPFDCKLRLGELAPELQRASPPFSSIGDANTSWADIPLYANICLDSVPVIVHHNGIKAAREITWNEFWVSSLLKSLHQRDFFRDRILAVADQRELRMEDLCPASMHESIFGAVI